MKPAFVPLADPIREHEIKLTLQWSADQRTTRAIKRQAALMGLETPTAYLIQALAAVISGNEEDTFVDSDGQLVNGGDIDRDQVRVK
jgi:hypothetical protein